MGRRHVSYRKSKPGSRSPAYNAGHPARIHMPEPIGKGEFLQLVEKIHQGRTVKARRMG